MVDALALLRVSCFSWVDWRARGMLMRSRQMKARRYSFLRFIFLIV